MAFASSVCPHDCPSTCALEVELLSPTQIGRVRGAADNSYTAGVICAKVARYAERVHHPERLTQPLLRNGPRGSGQFRAITWDEALDRVASAFTDATAKHGSESVWPYYFAGTMGLLQRDGIHRLRHAMRYSRQQNTICTSIMESATMAALGSIRGPDAREMGEADLIVMWGGNPVATQVNVMTHISRARKERGAKLVVIDPYRSGTAVVADMHLALRPGTDAALACAVLHIALRDGHADHAYMAEFTDFGPDVAAHLASRGPEWAAAITGLTTAQIEEFAALYCRTERAFLRVGYGFARSRGGAAALHAVLCLPSITGKWRHKGGGALWNQRAIYHWNKTLIEGLDVLDRTTRVMDMSRIGAVLCGDPQELQGGPPVTAMLIQNVNPLDVAPDTNKVRRGFAREDLFVCVHEQFMTPTALQADLVLPATMFLEHDDVYQAGGHSHIQIGRKLIAPPGEARSNHSLICDLAHRLGATHRGFGMSEMEVIDETLRASGWPEAREVIDRRWVDAQPSFEESHFLNGFGHPDKRFRFKPDWAGIGRLGHVMTPMPDHLDRIENPTEAHPFRLITSPARQFLNTSFTETPGSRKREGRPTALLNAQDAARLGATPGARLRLFNNRGAVVVHAEIAQGQLPGTVVVEGIWPSEYFETGIGINALTSDEPAPPLGGAVFHDTAIALEVLEASAQMPLAAE